MTRVKVCGLRRREDVELAIELGASALGFVLWPNSPRAVAVEDLRGLTAELPAFVAPVGVFVNQEAEFVRTAVSVGRLAAVQLHGDEDVTAYVGCGAAVIKAMAVGEEFSPHRVDEVPRNVTILLDAHDPIKRGGTGRTIDWAAAGRAARRRPVILSGGLTPDNVQAAIAAVQPFAVDVSSGVESAPGVKDKSKLRAFFDAVKR